MAFLFKTKIMNKSLVLLLLMATTFSLGSCSSKYAAQLSSHKSTFDRLVSSKQSPESKLDALAENIVLMMGESLSIKNPKKGVKYVRSYAKDNDRSIDLLLKEIGEWQRSMNLIEKASFAMSLAKKPYIKEMKSLAPQFKKKYKQIEFASKITGRLGKGILNIGQ